MIDNRLLENQEYQNIIRSDYQSGGIYQAIENIKSMSRTDTLSISSPVLLGRYSDSENYYPVSDIQTILFGENPTGNMTDYFHENSYGSFTLTGDVLDWQTNPETQSFYSTGGNGFQGGGARFARDLAANNDQYVNYGQYDNDGPDGIPNSGDDDGYVDGLIVVHTGGGAETGDSDNIGSHRWNFNGAHSWYPGIMPDGEYVSNDPCTNGGFIKINDYIVLPETSWNGTWGEAIIQIGVFCHEFSHILGLPDLYGGGNGIGYWGLMASGGYGGPDNHTEKPSHLCAWSKIQLGWVDPILVSDDIFNEAISEVEFNPQIYLVTSSGAPAWEYYLIENRQRAGFDEFLPGDGLCIWHIDASVSGNNNGNHLMVDLEEADGLHQLNSGINRGDSGDLFPGLTGNHNFNIDTNPSSSYYILNNTHSSILNISESNSVMTADIQILNDFEHIYGCGDPAGINYNPDVTINDGSCTYEESFYPPDNVTAIGQDGSITLAWQESTNSMVTDIQYDNGLMNYAFYYLQPFEDGGAHGMRFDVSGQYEILSASVRVLSEGDPYWPWPNSTHGPVRIIIMSDLGGVPNEVIWDEEAIAENGWASIYPNLTDLSGSFYIIASHAGNWSQGGDPEGFGVDNVVNYPSHMVTLDGGQWHTGDFLNWGGDYMFSTTIDVCCSSQPLVLTNENPSDYIYTISESVEAPIPEDISPGDRYSEPIVNTNQFHRDYPNYNIYRDGYSYSSAVEDTTFEDVGLDYYEMHCYQITALDELHESELSEQACAVATSESIPGCTDPVALNYNPFANLDDGSCEYADIVVPVDYPTIQSAINASVDGQLIIVQPGIYLENINFQGKAITVASLFYMADDTSYIFNTVINGNQTGSVVTFNNHETNNAILKGFTITNGLSENGGGIYFEASSPSFSDLIVTENTAINDGGGIKGLGNNGSISPSFTNVEISNNEAGNKGGGLYIYNAHATMDNLTITGNQCGSQGGGIYATSNSHFSLTGGIIQNNTANDGAGINFDSSSPTFTDLLVSDNIAVNIGGGIYGHSTNGVITPSFTNVQIIDNESGGSGGGLYIYNAHATMDNLTITGNQCGSQGGGVYLNQSNINVINSIFWSNSPHEVYMNGNYNTFLISHTVLEGAYSGIINFESNQIHWLENNLDEDPIFMFPDTSNYSLQFGSPCIDSGAELVVFEGDTLYQTEPGNYLGVAPDMGAIEFNIAEQYLNGDVNGDFQVDVLDVVILVQIILGDIEPTDYQLWAADPNQDLNIDVLDVVILVNIIILI